MTYRERRERRAERLREWAGKRVQRANATLEADRVFTDDYAFNTQPGHIPERARVIAREDRAFESLNKAKSMNSRADGIESQLASSIYSDDPDAVEQLQARIASLEAERDRIKAYNVSCRRGQRDLSLLDEAQKRALAGAMQYASFQCKGGAFPSYALSNLSADIRRNRDRLAKLAKEGA